MGERGPAQRPSAIKRAQAMRPDRINDLEPRAEPLRGVPAPPEHLDDVGREVWEHLASSLHEAHVLTVWDLEPFAAFCELVSTTRRAAALIEPGLLTKGRRDALVTNPAFRIYRDCLVLLRMYAREFGLTPSSRSGLEIVTERSFLRGRALQPRSPRPDD